MKRNSFILFFSLLGISGFSQQLPQFTQYNSLGHYINPASTGAASELSVGLVGRHQWEGLKDHTGQRINPRTYMLFLETPLHFINSGIGVTAFLDRLGFDENLNFRLNYAYHIEVGTGSKLSLGASFDYHRQTVDLKDYGLLTDDPGFERKTASSPDFGTGIFFTGASGIFAGISAHNILNSSFDFEAYSSINSTQYQFVAGSIFNVVDARNYQIDLLPSILIKTSNLVPAQFDVNAIAMLNNKYFGGLMYRYQDAVGLILGATIYNFRLGFSYDYTTNSLRKAGSKGSPELLVSYRKTIEPKIKWRSLYNTRDL